MCGRFTLRTSLNLLLQQFAAEIQDDNQLTLFGPRYNIAPTQDILAIRATNGQRQAAMLRWGLVPSWAKDFKGGPPLINARADSLAAKPAFRTAYKRRRCLVPADGFYEWKKAEGAKKQPFYIHRPDNQPFAFAGLWERWDGGPVIDSCTIITTDANNTMSGLHDRMPVILAPNDYALWLDAGVEEPGALQHLLAPCNEDELIAEPVSTHVNRVSNDDAKCVKILTQPTDGRTLFN
jgi:putative SOS response-associated peptidase YedK